MPAVLKTADPSPGPWVRIPLPPPVTHQARIPAVVAIQSKYGRVVKLAATADSKSAEGNLMSVRVRPRPPSLPYLLGLKELLILSSTNEGCRGLAYDA